MQLYYSCVMCIVISNLKFHGSLEACAIGVNGEDLELLGSPTRSAKFIWTIDSDHMCGEHIQIKMWHWGGGLVIFHHIIFLVKSSFKNTNDGTIY